VTGKRGPITGAKRVLTAVPSVPAVTFSAPDPPEDLGRVGAAIWRAIWPAMPVLNPVIDAYEVGRYCSAAEDAARARAELGKRGLVLEEVIPDPRGGVAGHRVVVNPAEAALRRADRLLTDLSDRLGLTPAARARLGLTINAAELAGAEADRILGSMFRGAEEDE